MLKSTSIRSRAARGLLGVAAFLLVSVGAALLALVLMTAWCGC